MPVSAIVNGEAVELAREMTLAEFVDSRKLSGRRIAVAHNGRVVERERLAETMIADGDVIEIVRPVGGG